jgi:GNAT superfamily N-acetyltransferase
MVEFRPLSLDDDRDFMLDMFIMRAFEAASEPERRAGLNQFRPAWLASPEATVAVSSVETSLKDTRTIAEIVVVNGTDAGFLWLTFASEPSGVCFAELRLVAFRLSFQRQGLGRVSIHHLEEQAALRGAESIRSIGSASTEGIRRFHASLGFHPVQTVFEKRLSPGTT